MKKILLLTCLIIFIPFLVVNLFINIKRSPNIIELIRKILNIKSPFLLLSFFGYII